MNRLSLILLLILFSCKNHENIEPIGLIKLDSNWVKKETYYWKLTVKDSSYFEISQEDLSKYANYNINESYELNNTHEIKIKKFILRDYKTGNKISETDTYIKSVNLDFNTELDHSYNYKSKEYSTFIIDSMRTKIKKKADSIALQKFYIEAERKNLVICGTVAGMMFEKHFLRELPNELNSDSILLILKNWKLN